MWERKDKEKKMCFLSILFRDLNYRKKKRLIMLKLEVIKMSH